MPLDGWAWGDMRTSRILQPGQNCWRLSPASRAAFLIDRENYFSAFRAAVKEARHSIFILGWDMDSRVRLERNGRNDGYPSELGKFLNAAVGRSKGVHAYILIWDFAMVYALEREWFSIYKLDWRTHRRIRFCLDGDHPPGASHHQKVVVIDDRIAFVGGFDLSKWRWDTRAHKADDPRRVDPDGAAYPPFHDVQLLVEGQAAADLGELFRGRWSQATGRHIRASVDQAADPWPAEVSADLQDIKVAIARTQPAHKNLKACREVERLYTDMIAAAKRSIYLENQYFTSKKVGESISKRLQEKDGPEIILVLPLKTGGWLEQNTMDAMRTSLLKGLQEADTHHRLRVYYPSREGLGDQCISVHGKVMVIDDRVVRVGSSNLSNRSMGLDTECDLAMEADASTSESQAIAAFRNSLLGEHLGVEPQRVHDIMNQPGSLTRTIEELQGGSKPLGELKLSTSSSIEWEIPEAELADSERPLDPESLMEYFVPQKEQRTTLHRVIVLVAVILLVILMAGLWHWSPLGEWLTVDRLNDLILQARQSAWTPVIVLGGYLLGGLMALPVTLMVAATALAMGPLAGSLYSFAGTLSSALLTFGIGHLLGRNAMRRLPGSTLNRISRRLADRGLVTVITFRLLPVAPFIVINLVAGASHLRWRDYLVGSAIGLAPGVLAVSLLTDRLSETLQQPSVTNMIILVAIALLVAGLLIWLV